MQREKVPSTHQNVSMKDNNIDIKIHGTIIIKKTYHVYAPEIYKTVKILVFLKFVVNFQSVSRSSFVDCCMLLVLFPTGCLYKTTGTQRQTTIFHLKNEHPNLYYSSLLHISTYLACRLNLYYCSFLNYFN